MIDVQNNGQVVQLFFNRPEKRNALNLELLQSLAHELEKARDCPTVRIVVLRGKGDAFSSGLDLQEMTDPQKREKMGTALLHVFHILRKAAYVSIAVAHGAAVAGGAGLMAACDLVIASEDCRIGFPELRRGVVASQISVLLARQIAPRHLRELVLVGDLISAERARQMGLVNRVVRLAALNDELQTMINGIVKGAPEATVFALQYIDDLYDKGLEEDMERALATFHKTWATAEAKEGIAAFNENRAPSWWQK